MLEGRAIYNDIFESFVQYQMFDMIKCPLKVNKAIKYTSTDISRHLRASTFIPNKVFLVSNPLCAGHAGQFKFEGQQPMSALI